MSLKPTPRKRGILLSDFRKSEGKKEKMGCPISKKVGKWDVKSRKMNETQIRETMKMACTPPDPITHVCSLTGK